ncbi:MAG TPA: hypothetical protein VGM56_07480 [Byssovorax sp.]|jgi:hypothetical protein
MTDPLAAFIAKWSASGAAERANKSARDHDVLTRARTTEGSARVAARAAASQTRAMSTAALAAEPEPIVIFRGVNRDGATYELDPRSSTRLRERFGAAAHLRARVFISHETRADYDDMDVALAPQLVMLLTGLSEDRLAELGGVAFYDPVEDRPLHPAPR